MLAPACLVLSRHQGGVCAATLGIDLALASPAPLGKCLGLDGYAHGVLPLPLELQLGVDDALNKFGVAVVKGVAVLHEALGFVPIGLAEKGDGNAL